MAAVHETVGVRRMSTLTRNSTALSSDPYRSDDIPDELYSDTGRRFSEADTFRGTSGVSGPARERIRENIPWRTALAALLLFSLGLLFILLGILHFRDEDDKGAHIAFIVMGSVAFIPGVYVVYNLFHAWRGTPGFHLSQIAHFDDYRW